MNISRRAFASLSLTAPLAMLSACGGAQPAPAPEKTFAPYWVSEKVETGGKEFDIKGNLGIAVEDFMALALYEDGTGQSADMDGGSESFKWSEKDGVISIDGMNEGESLKRDGDKLVFTIDPQGENVVVTFKNVTDMPQQLKGSFDAMKQFAPRFDSAQTMRMSTYMLDGIMTLANDKYYGMYYDTISGNMHQGLGMLDFWMSESANIHTDNLVMLDTDCSPTHVQVSGEYVYYVREDRETEKLSLCRVKADGSAGATASTGNGNSWGWNYNCFDSKQFNNAKYLAGFVVSHFPHWGIGPRLYLYDITNPAGISGDFESCGALVMSNTNVGWFQKGDAGVAAGDVLIAPSSDGFMLYIYYYDHNSQVIGGYSADCIKR